MATATVENVIPLNAFQRNADRPRPKMTGAETGALEDCRDLALSRICQVLAKAFDSIDDELFQLAERAGDREAQNLYLDARAQSREKRTSIEQSFRKQFVGFFNGKVTADSGPSALKPSGAALDFGTLSLVDDSALEESIAVSEMSKKLKSRCEDELFALSQRMGFLMHDPDLPDDANPLSPDTVCKALKEACEQITSGYRVKLTILKLFEQHVAEDLIGIYRDVNSHLVTRYQILPQIRPTYRKATQARKPGDPVVPGSGAPKDLFNTLQQLMAGGGPAGLLVRGPDGSQIGAAGAGQGPQQGAAMPTAGLISALTDIQQGAPGASAGSFVAPQPGVAGQPVNVLHEIKAQGVAQGAAQVDSMTLDIVAMLFDYVFDDKHIPDAIKALLGQLQIPVLKVALLDKSFFSTKLHPARRLLDRLAEAALECDEVIDRDDPLYIHIAASVAKIQADFHTDVGLFSEQLDALEAFIAAREQDNATFVERSSRLDEQREAREIARLVAESAINERLASKTLPGPVVVMLKGRWVDVLRAAHLDGGEDGLCWSTACETIDDLIWSVEPKNSAEDRKILVSLLPRLLKRLQEGMRIAGVEEPERDRFFAALVDCHSSAVKAGLRGDFTTAAVAAKQAWVDATSYEGEGAGLPGQVPHPVTTDGFTHIEIESDGIKVEEISLPRAPGKTAGDGFDMPESIAPRIEKGAWVEFRRVKGERARARLTWISPRRGIYLFTNPQGSGAISVTQEALAAQLRAGQARILEDTPLMDRAVESVIGSLQESAAAG